jgi:chitinase
MNHISDFCRRGKEKKMNTRKEKRKGRVVISKLILAVMFSWIVILCGQSTCFALNVLLKWDPNTESDLSGYKVYYKADTSSMPFDGTGAGGGSSPIDVHNQTTYTVNGLDPSRTYYFAVTAYNNSGIESEFSNIVAIPESVAPVISITYPGNNATLGGTVSVTAAASDNVGVTKVEFYANGTLQATDTSTPYVYSWNTSSSVAGSYTLMAKAYDAAGNVGQSANINVTVVKDSTPPSVSLTSPKNNAKVSGTVAITASASDNVGVAKVEFYENGELISASNVAPYSSNWDTRSVADGKYALSAKVYDASGNVGQSANINVTVLNDTVKPTVSISTPANNATVSGTVLVTAIANDNVGVTRVEFVVNGAWKATVRTPPYSFSWNTTTAANGSCAVTAMAWDAGQNAGRSDIKVTVNNTSKVTSSRKNSSSKRR